MQVRLAQLSGEPPPGHFVLSALRLYAILDMNGVDPARVRDRINEVVKRGSANLQGDRPYTTRAKKVLELSMREAAEFGHDHVGTGHL